MPVLSNMLGSMLGLGHCCPDLYSCAALQHVLASTPHYSPIVSRTQGHTSSTVQLVPSVEIESDVAVDSGDQKRTLHAKNSNPAHQHNAQTCLGTALEG